MNNDAVVLDRQKWTLVVYPHNQQISHLCDSE